ncbi:MAG: hypothetical protein C4576_31620 [Desulfobacteraceae bacterium]|nr:MAG: hypothetical protein C4576_31620 [Desulfobacteraceae bacterium]
MAHSRSPEKRGRVGEGVQSRGPVEIARRLALLAGLVTAVALCFWTRFEPYVMISPAHPEDIARLESRREPEAQRTGALLDRRDGHGREEGSLTVRGPEWEELFVGVRETFAQNYPIPGWEHRIGKRDLDQARKDNERRSRMTATDLYKEQDRIRRVKERYGTDVTFRGSFRHLYFSAREKPLDRAIDQWPVRSRYILQLSDAQGPRLSAVHLPAYELIGFADVITLPEAFSYPHRHMAHWPALMGFALYIFLPWGRRAPGVLAYARWRIVLGDGATGLLMFGSFFSMPFAIIGGTVETLTTYAGFAIVFWLIAALGLLGLYWSAWTAAFRLSVGSEALAVSALSKSRIIRYDSIKEVRPVRLRPPKWLIALMWAAALLGRKPGAVGQALLLGAGESNGVRLDLVDGSHAYIWYSDQMGAESIPHFERFRRSVQRDAIKWVETPLEIRAVFPPIG